MTKILKILFAIFLCSFCGIFSAVVAQSPEPAGSVHTEDGRVFKVYPICKTLWNENEWQWNVKMGWYSNSSFALTKSELLGGLEGWNTIGARPINQMVAGTFNESFSVLLIDGNGYPIPEDQSITWTITDWAGNSSSADANMSVPTCQPPPTPTLIPKPTQEPRDNCPAWATQSATGTLVCLWDLPTATTR